MAPFSWLERWLERCPGPGDWRYHLWHYLWLWHGKFDTLRPGKSVEKWWWNDGDIIYVWPCYRIARTKLSEGFGGFSMGITLSELAVDRSPFQQRPFTMWNIHVSIPIRFTKPCFVNFGICSSIGAKFGCSNTFPPTFWAIHISFPPFALCT